MHGMKDRYVSCYLSGRHDEYEGEIDIEQIVARAFGSIGGVSVREATHAAAKAAITAEMDAAAKVEWLKDNLEAIKGMGGDTEKAWRLFVQGRVDALAYQLEDETMEAIVNQLEEEEDEEDPDDDDSDESDDDDDSDESDEEDEEDEE